MELSGILAGERDAIANQANFAALLFMRLPDVNWVGFYRRVDDGLILGPFQGKPACVRLPASRGVCAAAASSCETVVVADVHDFDGHIACDPLSRAEIVVPAIHQGQLLGVLDLDSPRSGRFRPADRVGLERLVEMLVEACDW
ncbi:MAG: GAF domain-containing protein [Luteolibacter sp.]